MPRSRIRRSSAFSFTRPGGFKDNDLAASESVRRSPRAETVQYASDGPEVSRRAAAFGAVTLNGSPINDAARLLEDAAAIAHRSASESHEDQRDAGLASLERLAAVAERCISPPRTWAIRAWRLVKKLSSLQKLYLPETKVGDGGVKDLANLTQLQDLDFQDTKITAATRSLEGHEQVANAKPQLYADQRQGAD